MTSLEDRHGEILEGRKMEFSLLAHLFAFVALQQGLVQLGLPTLKKDDLLCS